MLFQKKTLKDCQVSPHYFWFVKTKKFGIINLCGEKGKLKRIIGTKAEIIFDKYGKQTVPANLVTIK